MLGTAQKVMIKTGIGFTETEPWVAAPAAQAATATATAAAAATSALAVARQVKRTLLLVIP